MKKTILIAFLVSVMMPIWATTNYVHYYINCNGVRTEIHVSDDIKQPCVTICRGCKFEMAWRFGTNFDSDPNNNPLSSNLPNVIFTHTLSNGSTVTNAVNGVNYAENGIAYYSIDISQFPNTDLMGGAIMQFIFQNPQGPVGQQGSDISGRFEFPCFNIIATNNKDNIEILGRSICAGDCLNIDNEIITGNKDADGNLKVYRTDISCPGAQIVSSGGNGGGNPGTPREICFNIPGVYPVSATVKDACGEKIITGNITVIECNVTGGLACEACCAAISQFVANPVIINGMLIIPAEIRACLGSVKFYYEDGTFIQLDPRSTSIPAFNSSGSKLYSLTHWNDLGTNNCPCMASYLFP